jgi:hypothetical protein
MPLNPSETHSEVEINKSIVFDELIERRHGTSINPPKPIKGEFDAKKPDDADGDAEHEPAEEFPDGELKEHAANILVENMLSQVDHEGHNMMLMRDIIDYKTYEAMAVPMKDKYLTTRSSQRRLRKTTQGWSLLVNWKDGTASWVKPAELKDSYPIELAKFAKALSIAHEPAFAWWVPHTRRNAIGVAFEVLEDGKSAPQGYTKASGHIIWDLKMDFTRKARWVLDGHKLPTPEGSTYAGCFANV